MQYAPFALAGDGLRTLLLSNNVSALTSGAALLLCFRVGLLQHADRLLSVFFYRGDLLCLMCC